MRPRPKQTRRNCLQAFKSSAAYFVDFVVAQIREWNPDVASEIYRGGYEVYTTLDLDMQAAAEQAFSRYMPEGTQDAQGITQPQGALVAVEPYTGHMKALIGGRSYSETQLNRAYQVRRQPGSAFKIFLYAAVLDSGYGISHTQMCEPVEFPENLQATCTSQGTLAGNHIITHLWMSARQLLYRTTWLPPSGHQRSAQAPLSVRKKTGGREPS